MKNVLFLLIFLHNSALGKEEFFPFSGEILRLLIVFGKTFKFASVVKYIGV
jgi:hypothetical protein